MARNELHAVMTILLVNFIALSYPTVAVAEEWWSVASARSDDPVPADENWWHNFAPPGADYPIKAAVPARMEMVSGIKYRD